MLYIYEKNVIVMSLTTGYGVEKKSKNNCTLVYALEYSETTTMMKAHAIAIL
jgi:hypothetical protein